jgi:eukaryotic-like serine/threonine-protein kinase
MITGPAADDHDHELAVVRQQIASALFPRRSSATTQRIGRFVVERRLGAGAMGVVYAARDPALDRRVAIKLVRPDVSYDHEAQRRLEREARALAKLSHPNIVAIHEVGEHQGQLFLAMEHVQGQSLRAWQEEARRSTWEVLAMYVQAGRGLAAAHAAGLVHRDFKPDNVLVDDDGRARVVDFGLVGGDDEERRAELARWEAKGMCSELLLTTNTHAFVGTPAYMSPEQFDGRAIDARSDQFGFCVALYEALYGRHPFDARSLSALRASVLAGRVSPPPARSPVSARTRRLLLRGLAPSPADRHPSLESLLDALSRDPAMARSRWLAVGSLVIAASAGTYALASRGAPEAPPPCIGVEGELAQAWNDERRATVATAVLATGVPHAQQTLACLEPVLDDYAAAWTEMRSQTCQAHAEGLESDRQHDLRVACLARRRVALEALVDVLAEPTRGDVDHAVQAASALPGIEACGDVEALAAAIPRPEDSNVARAVEAHRATLARIREYEVLGRYDKGRALATAVVDSAEAKAHAPLEAEALLSLGAVELASQRYERATDVLSRALEVALRAGHLDVAAEAFARRIFTYGQLSRIEDVEHDVPLARSLIERTRDDHLRWLYFNNVGTAYKRSERYAEAKAAMLEALDAKQRAHGQRHFEYAVTLDNLIGVEVALGEMEAARVAIRLRREIYEQTLGSEHPFVVKAVYSDSRRLYHDGALDAAHSSMIPAVERMASSSASHRSPG